MAYVVWFIITTAVAITVYLGLAVYVVTHNPRHSISWVFGGFCLTLVSFYLSNLFLIAGPEPPPLVTPGPLRWRWAVGSFTPTLFLHLTSFYFPPGWCWSRRWVLRPAYLFSTGLALAALFSDLLVSGLLYRPRRPVLGPVVGPLMYAFAGFFVLVVAGGVAGLVTGYRTTRFPSLRHQIRHLLIAVGFMISSGLIAWYSVLLVTDVGRALPAWVDGLMIGAGFLYIRAVLRYGLFIGRPMARQELFYSLLTTAVGLVALYLTLTLDRWLMTYYMPVPYPLATGMLVVTIALSFPVLSPWVTVRLDQALFRAEAQQRVMARNLAGVLAEIPDPAQLPAQLLGAFCATLNVRDGYIALADPNRPPERLTIQVVQGSLPLQEGDCVRQPPLHSQKPRLATILLPRQQTEPGWREVALFCPLVTDREVRGMVALGEKRDGTPFTRPELALCAELARQLEVSGQMLRLRNQPLETPPHQRQTLPQPVAPTTDAPPQTLVTRQQHPVDMPLAIRLLGPLQVARNGVTVPETAWGTERAKVLLAYLLWKGPVGATRAEISTALWPNRPPEETDNVFHVTLHRLRHALEPELRRARDSHYIRYTGGRYRFNLEASHWLDVTAFRALVATGEPAALQEAMVLYRGPYLEDTGWALPPEVEAEQQALEQLYVTALRQLAAQADGQAAVPYLEKLLAIEPTDEAAQQTLVLGYLARGRHDLARRQVVRWQQALAELDLAPSPETEALWRRVADRGR